MHIILIRQAGLIGRMGLIGVYLALFVLSFIPRTVRADSCCACFYVSGGNTTNVCFDGTKVNEADCNKSTGANSNKILLENGNYVSCKYFADCSTPALISRCPDVRGSTMIVRQTVQQLNLHAPTAPIRFKPSVPIPGMSGAEVEVDFDTIATYIIAIYKFIIGSIGLLAVIGIMIGGFQYLMAAGAPDKITEAKTSITSAIVGLIIGLTSYLLLSSINPNLVDFSQGTTSLTSVQQQLVDSMQNNADPNVAGGPSICKVEKDTGFTPVTSSSFGAEAKYFEVQDTNAYLLQNAIDLLKSTINSRGTLGSSQTFGQWLDANKFKVVITSTYRNTFEQQQLKNCYDFKIKDTAICPYNCGNQCAAAATPNCDLGHQSALAIDLCLKDMAPGDGISPGAAACGMRCNGNIADPRSDPIQLAFHRYFEAMGWGLLKSEWWHFDHPDLKARYGATATRYRISGGAYNIFGCF